MEGKINSHFQFTGIQAKMLFAVTDHLALLRFLTGLELREGK